MKNPLALCYLPSFNARLGRCAHGGAETQPHKMTFYAAPDELLRSLSFRDFCVATACRAKRGARDERHSLRLSLSLGRLLFRQKRVQSVPGKTLFADDFHAVGIFLVVILLIALGIRRARGIERRILEKWGQR